LKVGTIIILKFESQPTEFARKEQKKKRRRRRGEKGEGQREGRIEGTHSRTKAPFALDATIKIQLDKRKSGQSYPSRKGEEKLP